MRLEALEHPSCLSKKYYTTTAPPAQHLARGFLLKLLWSSAYTTTLSTDVPHFPLSAWVHDMTLQQYCCCQPQRQLECVSTWSGLLQDHVNLLPRHQKLRGSNLSMQSFVRQCTSWSGRLDPSRNSLRSWNLLYMIVLLPREVMCS